MKYDVKVPAVGESINEATIGSWLKQNGEAVKRNDVLMSLETDKATVEVVAEQDGVLQISVQAGQVVAIGAVVAQIDSDAKASFTSSAPSAAAPTPAAPAPTASAPAASNTKDLNLQLSPAVQRVVSERGLDPQSIQGTGRDGRLTKDDVVRAPAPAAVAVINTPNSAAPAASAKPAPAPLAARGSAQQGDQRRVPMTTIRRRIAERLVQSQQTTATLTTFNEVDMTRAMEIRAKYKDKFKERYGVSLGFMGIFVKAATDALQTMPAVNAFIDGQDVIYNNYFNIGVAVSTEKGLLVPVVRDADQLSIPQIESAIRDYALKARDGKITMDDLSGGTFTISNGGVFGSLMSTPILNPPQSGILGMHKIQDRPVVVDGKIEIRPMMYIALSYDHRMIDGREAVTFLVKIKEGVEDPERLLIGV